MVCNNGNENFVLGKSGKFCPRGGSKWVLKVWMDISMLNEWKGAFRIEGLKKAKL